MTQTPPSPARPDELHRFVLDNGLEVLVEPMHHAPVVALQAWVHVGAADENKARAAGLAHLHEHMLFKGTRKRGVGEVARTIEAVGGEMNAWTSFDETVYHLVLDRAQGELGSELLADMLMNSVFDPDELAREIEVVLEEIRRAQDSPMRRMSYAMFRMAFRQHAYRDPVLGTSQSVSATRRADMLAFFHEHYRPNNTTYLIVGDVAPDEGRAWAERAFGGWRPAPAVAEELSTRAERVKEPAPTGVSVEVLAEDVQEARLSLSWPGPAARDEATAALDLFSVALGHGDSSRLYQQLVRPRHLLGAYASCYTPKDPGLFMVGATFTSARPSREEVSEALARLLGQAHVLAAGPLPDDELSKARALILSDAAFSRETMEGQARKRGFYHAAAGSWQHEEAYLQSVRTVSGEAVSTAARHVLSAPPALVLQLPKDGTDSAQQIDVGDVTAALQQARADASPGEIPKRSKQTLLPAAGELGVIRLKLPQGPLLLLWPQPGPVVAVRALALGGQRLEEAPTAGLSALFANCWAQASQKTAAPEFSRRLAELAAHLSAFRGRNTVGLSAEAVDGRLDQALPLLFESLFAPAFPKEDVARERHGLLERIRSREDNPAGVAVDLFLRTLFAAHPYGLPGLGTAQSIAGLDEAALETYHGRFLSPERMVIAVVGPFDAKAVASALQQAQVEHNAGEPETLEQALRLNQPLPTPPPEAAPTSPRKASHALDKEQTHVLVGSQGVALADPDSHPLAVLSAVLSGQSGRLFSDLRDVQSLAYSLSCSSAEGLDPGHVVVHMACSPQKQQQALEGVYKHLRALREEAIGEHELARAQNVLVGGHAIDLQRAGARALSLATGEMYGLGYSHFMGYEKRIRAVSAADVQRVARAYLGEERLVQALVGR